MIRRSLKVTFRVSQQEKTRLSKLAADSGASMEQVLRDLIMGTEIRSRPPAEWPEAVRQLSAIGNNINQIARVANTQRDIDMAAIAEIQTMQAQIWRLVKGL